MSALARYFLHEGRRVAGYDRTPSPITEALVKEGAEIHYEDNTESIGADWRNAAETVVVYTPAVPSDMSELKFFREGGFEVLKRSEMLGHLTEGKFVTAIAGTHGKTTTTTLTAWITRAANGSGSAFLGGISKNFGSNLVLGKGYRMAVEADEFDRSFLRLHPKVAVVTSADADHLDIYGTVEELKKAFVGFISQIEPMGTLIIKKGVDLKFSFNHFKTYTYSLEDTAADFHAENLTAGDDGRFGFDIVCPDRTIEGCRLGVGGKINVENAVAAVAALWAAGWYDEHKLKEGLASFEGVKRRFECYINSPRQVYIDDYAHHPNELRAAISSIRGMFPGRKLTAVFQPHLYTRTRDFHKDFAKALTEADEVFLLPIYPAREEPIAGIDSELIASGVKKPCRVVAKADIASALSAADTDVVVTFGAGDIDKECTAIAEALEAKA